MYLLHKVVATYNKVFYIFTKRAKSGFRWKKGSKLMVTE
jgi:hypothetical protein